MDEFDAGFDEALKEDGGKDAATLQTGQEAAATIAPAPAPADGQGVAEPVHPETHGEDTGHGDAPAPAPAEDEDPEKLHHKLKTLQGMLSRQGEELREMRERMKASQSQHVDPPAKAEPKAAAAPTPAAPTEEDELVAELEEASPTLARAVKALLKKEREAIKSELSADVSRLVEPIEAQVKPLSERAQAEEVQAHFRAIESKHAGWETTVQSAEFIGWAQNQPAYVRRELARVAQQGSAADVIEVLDDFKRWQQTSARSGTNQDPVRAAQRAALSTVPSRPANGKPKVVDMDDFDAGFNSA